MELDGAGVVVTGGGSGIGAALVRSFAAAGARVVVNDLDAVKAEVVALETGGYPVPGDASSAEGVRILIKEARAQLGEIDLFCANAGVGGAPTLDAEDGWELAWNVNVMAHVRAARELLPHWLERGRGHFLATVSAAGLLTMLGAPAYSVTKHGALAFAEWLSATYGERGITVQALCPMGVRTPMLEASGQAGELLLAPSAISVEEVAQTVLAGLDDDRFLILPHAEAADHYAKRAAYPDHWLAAMRKAQGELDAALEQAAAAEDAQ